MNCGKYVLAFALCICVVGTEVVNAQNTSLDRVVAVVGDEPILLSDVQPTMQQMAMADPELSSKPTQDVLKNKDLFKRALDMQIDNKLLYVKAMEDSVQVSGDEISGMIEEQIQRLKMRLGSEARIEQAFGVSIAEIKRNYRDVVREQLMVQRLMQRRFANMQVTQREVDAFYEEYKDSLPQIPDQVDLYHVVVHVQAPEEKRAEAFELASTLRDSIVMGTPFADIAARHSQDGPSSRKGGELGWIRRGAFIAEFEKAAFALQKGEISKPVETPFGFHIIELLDKEEDQVQVRHVLLKFAQTSEDKERVVTLLNSFQDSIANGVRFETLVDRFSEEDDTKARNGLWLERADVGDLPDELRTTIINMQDGEVTEALPYNLVPSKPAFHVVMRGTYYEAHIPDRVSDAKVIRQFALQKKQQKELQVWQEQLREEIFWKEM